MLTPLAAGLVASLAFASPPPKTAPTAKVGPVKATPVKADASIGTARMLPDGTLELMLRAEGGGALGDALLRYTPTDPRYQEILAHVGKDLKPGETRPVKPFPPTSAKQPLPLDAGAP